MNTKVKKILPFAILIIILLSIIIGILVSPKTYAATTVDGLFDYLKVYDNNTKTYIIKITKCNDIGENNIIIPSLIDECEVKIIGEDAIPWANKIKTLYIPETITLIEDGAFNRSLYMEEISVDNKNNNYCSENGILFNKNKTEIMHYPAKKEDTSYQIPSSVTIIGDSCFYACGSLTNVNIPSNVVEIKRNAFKGCYSIQEITLPQGLTTLGDGAFSGASQLKQITIPNGIKKIEQETFLECLSLENVIMHNSITSIGTAAFEYCYKLDNVQIPDSVIEIKDRAFDNCRFEEIVIPDGVKSIKNQAFRNNPNLKIAVIPSSVEEIEWLAFSAINSDFKVYLLKDSKTEEYINSGTNCFKENTLYEYLTIDHINIKVPPTNTTYYVGDNFDSDGLKISGVYKYDNDKNVEYKIDSTKYTITPNQSLTYGTKNVTINYTHNNVTKSTTQPITVKKIELENISITSEPSNKTYIEGQNFDKTGMKVIANYNNRTSKEVTNYTITDGNNLTVGKTTITVSYTENDVTKTTTQAITVVKKALTSIEITTAPAKTTYIEGQNFDATGIKVTAKYSDNSSAEITNYTITDGNDLKTDKTSVIISYTENGITKTQEQSITVNQKTLNNLRISAPPSKTTYVEGQNFDATGMKVVAIYNNESEKEITNYTITDGNDLKTDKTSVTISYTENNVTKTATQSITVSKKVLNAIAITTKPNKTEYIEEQNFDTTGMKVTATYNDGTSKEVSNYTVTDGNKLAVGKTTVTVSYTENEVTKTVDQAITVSKKTLSSIRIFTAPNKTTYIEGQNFDATGMKVTAIYNNSTNKEVTDYIITGGNNLTTDKTSVIISYTESSITKTTTQPITVTKKLEISFDGYNEVNKDENKYIDNIAPSTTMENLINNIETSGTITIYKDNKEITDKKIKISTGMKIKISLNNENHEFTIVVKGDTNGDGESDLRDLLQINKHRLNKTLLTAEYLLAGDVNKDNEVNLKDLLQINKFRLGKINTL